MYLNRNGIKFSWNLITRYFIFQRQVVLWPQVELMMIWFTHKGWRDVNLFLYFPDLVLQTQTNYDKVTEEVEVDNVVGSTLFDDTIMYSNISVILFMMIMLSTWMDFIIMNTFWISHLFIQIRMKIIFVLNILLMDQMFEGR